MIAELFFTPKGASSTLANPSRWLLDAFGVRNSESGVTVNQSTALNVSAVYRANNKISNTFATLPIQLFRRTGRGNELASDHPRYALMHDAPCPEMTPFRFKRFTASGRTLWGNGCAEIQRNGAGDPIWLWPIHPSRVSVSRNDNNDVVYVVQNDRGAPTTIAAENVFHVMGYSWDGMQGVSPVLLARDSIGLTKSAENYGNRFLKNDARPSGVIEHPLKLGEVAAQNLRNSWRTAQGGENQHSIAVLEEGMKFNPIGMPNEAMQFLELRQFQIVEIARWFDVPPHMLMDYSEAHYDNVENSKIEFAEDAILPLAKDWEEEANRKLLSEQDRAEGYFFECNMNGLLRADTKTRYEVYAIGRQWGIKSANDCRRLENENPIGPEGDMYLVPANMFPADMMRDKVQADIDKASGPPPAFGQPPQSGAPEGVSHDKIREAITQETRPTAAELQSAIRDAHRPLFLDAINRMLRLEASEMRRAPKGEKLAEYREKFYASFGPKLRGAMIPVVDAFAAAMSATVGRDVDEKAVGGATAAICFSLTEMLRQNAPSGLALNAEDFVDGWVDKIALAAGVVF